jgi:hypothetical protein
MVSELSFRERSYSELAARSSESQPQWTILFHGNDLNADFAAHGQALFPEKWSRWRSRGHIVAETTDSQFLRLEYFSLADVAANILKMGSVLRIQRFRCSVLLGFFV